MSKYVLHDHEYVLVATEVMSVILLPLPPLLASCHYVDKHSRRFLLSS